MNPFAPSPQRGFETHKRANPNVKVAAAKPGCASNRQRLWPTLYTVMNIAPSLIRQSLK
jgi:hypothetical protein